ncbi:hypothetical protein JL721_4278 [Aureococcus anophagefferens]|nr:hypothetical protein JL721_4278 [Aureococcus anophagefferens]
MPAGYLLVSAFHKQAFASATQHQLLAFLQVAAFTNRTAVLPFARFGEPAFVGLPEAGFNDLERYFDVADLAKRWPCLRVLNYREFRSEHGKPPVALQLGTPRTAVGDVVPSGCGKRSRPLVALKATFACASLTLLASARRALGGDRWRTDAVVVTNWSQKVVGLGDASSPLFGDAFAARGGCHDAAAARDARVRARGSLGAGQQRAALCRRATHVWRFGSGTFSAFLVGDAADAPPSTRFLSCPDIAAAAGQLE